jgi:exonuclease VII small subunit
MALKKTELEAQLRELEETVRRLATHAAVLAAAVRDPNAVPAADLEAALAGLEEIARAI